MGRLKARNGRRTSDCQVDAAGLNIGSVSVSGVELSR
jgi:hypothetical protein